jgi:hypothetical protein
MTNGVKIGNYTYYKSTLLSKKLMTCVNEKWLHFGDSSAEHYEDKTNIWKDRNHYDKTKRESYLKRAKGISNKKGLRTWNNPDYANYHSYHILW